MASICLSGAGVIVSAILALPTLAGHQLQDNLAKSLRGTGQRLSGSVHSLILADCKSDTEIKSASTIACSIK